MTTDTAPLQLRVEQFFAEGFAERKVIFVHDILKLCQRCHTALQRGLKASQREDAGTRACAVHRGSALSSLASSNPEKTSRPLVEKGLPGGGKKFLQAAQKHNLRGSGGMLAAEAQQAQQQSKIAKVYVEDDDEMLQPRAMRPPAPHSIFPFQNARVVPPSSASAQSGMQGGGTVAADAHYLGEYGAFAGDHGGGAVPDEMKMPGPPYLRKTSSMDWSDSQQVGALKRALMFLKKKFHTHMRAVQCAYKSPRVGLITQIQQSHSYI